MQKELRIASIVELVQNAPTRLGKTQVQKLVYFAQQCGIPLDYKYEIYHYGPYSFELSHEMGSLDSLGVLNIQSDPNGFGFDISAGKFAQRFKLEPKYQRKIEKILDHFGRNTPAELEVKATVHFVNSIVRRKISSGKARSEVVQKVHALKPRFTEDFIKRCYSDLERANWI
ncbi:MAG: hypothetical protein WCA49_08580 [Candidatus Sulfotelmatobacter sp.]